MNSSFNIANFFIDCANKCEISGMTQLKLHKLLYFAQGHHLARTGEPLFYESISAWMHGPVVEPVYHKYKWYKDNVITAVDEDYSADQFTDEEYETLLDVTREYGKYAASYLVDKTHKDGTPWKQTYDSGLETIPSDAIENYFINIERIPSFADSLRDNALLFEGYRDSDNLLVLPNEDDDEWEGYDDL